MLLIRILWKVLKIYLIGVASLAFGAFLFVILIHTLNGWQ